MSQSKTPIGGRETWDTQEHTAVGCRAGNMDSIARTFWLVAWPFLATTTLVHGAVEARTTVEIEHNLKIECSVHIAPPASLEDPTQTVLQTLQASVQVALAGLALQAPLGPAHSCPCVRGECLAPPLLVLRVTRLQI